MHLKNTFLFGLLAIILLGGTISPALSQSSPGSNSVVINEVEINPQNGSEFVELYNPTSQSIDISGWSLTPSMYWKEYEIIPNTIIESKSFAAFTYHSSWFKDFGDIISLTDSSGVLIDQTPLLVDQNNDANTWQRNTDGLDTNSISDWKLKTMTPKASNGIITQTEETIFSFTGQTDKTEYIFGDSFTISGSVSETLFVDIRNTMPDSIKIIIQGPAYYEDVTLYPDSDGNFSTTFNIQKLYGFSLGNYNVDISYGDASVKTEFAIIEELSTSSTETESEKIEIFTNKASYVPGETVILFADTNSTMEYAGLDYAVLDPNGKTIFSGTLFPNSEFSVVHQSGGGQLYPFSTQFLMHGVNPVYGTYEIQGIFKAQDPINRSSGIEMPASTTFEFIEDVRDESVFSLSTDKEVYSVGDTITVTGQSNHIWTENIDLEVQQTGLLTRAADAHKDQYIRPDPFTLEKSIDLNADGTFEFQFKLVHNADGQEDLSRYLGDYRLTVSEYFGNAHVNFMVVENPESFVDIRTPLGLEMSESEYVLGTAIFVSGKVLDYEFKESSNFNNFVTLTIADSTGKTMMSEDRIDTANDYGKSPNQPLLFTAIPDSIGNFQISTILNPLQFDTGKYIITAHHSLSKITESIGFEVVTAQSQILSSDETQEPLIFELCSSTRTSNSEIIKELEKISTGQITQSMSSIDCDGLNEYVVGEKLVIKGTVALKNPTSLDQSSVKTSGQTQSGHSYNTNEAMTVMNYVELSIPYPQTLVYTKNFRTVPDEGESYTGGGGQGAATKQDETRGDSVGTGAKQDQSFTTNSFTGYDGKAVLQQFKKNLLDMKVKVYPDDDGNFNSVFNLSAGVFTDGVFKMKVNYFGYNSEQSFSVVDNSLKGGLKPDMSLSVDKSEYIPGETVSISGKIENVYYYDPVSVTITTPDVSQINCLVGQQCESENTAKRIRVSEGVDGAYFYMNYKIPSVDGAIGKYTITADTHFGKVEKSFFVINESDIISQVSPEIVDSTQIITKKIIEKFNRIADSEIPIILTEKSSEDSSLVPRVIQGSLFTSARGEESDVTLRITTTDGQCVIGQNSECLVSESTRKPGEIYSIVSIDDENYKIRYSGNDVRLEKFSITPDDPNSKIDIDTWNVEIMKDEQPSRFYYKVSYVTLE